MVKTSRFYWISFGLLVICIYNKTNPVAWKQETLRHNIGLSAVNPEAHHKTSDFALDHHHTISWIPICILLSSKSTGSSLIMYKCYLCREKTKNTHTLATVFVIFAQYNLASTYIQVPCFLLRPTYVPYSRPHTAWFQHNERRTVIGCAEHHVVTWNTPVAGALFPQCASLLRCPPILYSRGLAYDITEIMTPCNVFGHVALHARVKSSHLCEKI